MGLSRSCTATSKSGELRRIHGYGLLAFRVNLSRTSQWIFRGLTKTRLFTMEWSIYRLEVVTVVAFMTASKVVSHTDTDKAVTRLISARRRQCKNKYRSEFCLIKLARLWLLEVACDTTMIPACQVCWSRKRMSLIRWQWRWKKLSKLYSRAGRRRKWVWSWKNNLKS